jgi:hypothetical protein
MTASRGVGGCLGVARPPEAVPVPGLGWPPNPLQMRLGIHRGSTGGGWDGAPAGRQPRGEASRPYLTPGGSPVRLQRTVRRWPSTARRGEPGGSRPLFLFASGQVAPSYIPTDHRAPSRRPANGPTAGEVLARRNFHGGLQKPARPSPDRLPCRRLPTSPRRGWGRGDSGPPPLRSPHHPRHDLLPGRPPRRGGQMFPPVGHPLDMVSEGANGGESCISTNLANEGLRSVARNNKATRLLTRPC